MGHSVPWNYHTRQEKAIFEMNLSLQADWVRCGLQGWREKTMVVGGVWQRQTPHNSWAVGVGSKLPNANKGA